MNAVKRSARIGHVCLCN